MLIQFFLVGFQIRTFKKIEPPCNESAFGMRVRKSIGVRFKKSDTEESDEETPRQVTTVKRKVGNSFAEQIAHLEAEKHALQQRLRFIEDDTREKVQEQFEKLLNDQRDYYG